MPGEHGPWHPLGTTPSGWGIPGYQPLVGVSGTGGQSRRQKMQAGGTSPLDSLTDADLQGLLNYFQKPGTPPHLVANIITRIQEIINARGIGTVGIQQTAGSQGYYGGGLITQRY